MRPEPISPANPTISPGRMSKLTSSIFSLRRRFLTSIIGLVPEGIVRSCQVKEAVLPAPSIASTMRGTDNPAVSSVITVSPSRITVTRSQSFRISAIRCEM